MSAAPKITDIEIARIDRDRAMRIAALWRGKPVLSDREIPEVIGLAYSSWQALKLTGDTPPLFRIGRRVYARTEDVRAWLDAKAEKAKTAEGSV